MKTSKKLSIGLGLTAIASISVAVVASEKIIEKISHVANRCKVKKIVNDTFNGNEKLLTIVDDLSDDELASILNVLEKVKDSRERMTEYGDSVKDNAENLKNRFMSFVEELI